MHADKQNEKCRELGLMTCRDAQSTQIVRLPNFLCDDEIAEIKSTLAEAQTALGNWSRVQKKGGMVFQSS